jgi:hypothetical protein
MNTFFETTELRKWGAVAAITLGLGLSGCGGGSSGSGDGDDGSFETASFNEEQAVVSGEDDAKTVSTAARESAQQAILEDEQPDQNFPVAVSIAANGEQLPVYDISMSLIDAAMIPSAVEVPVEGDCGGRAVVSYTEDMSDYQIDYQDYCTAYGGEQYIIDGYYDWDNFDDSSNYSLTFDYTVTYLGETYRSKGTYSCNNGECAYQNYFVGTDGRQYRTENVSVYGSNGSYSVSARVYDQDLGYVDYEASNLTLCDSGVGFSSGTITVTASGGTLVEVTFSSCDSYTVTYNGSAYTVNY